jgi:anti-sigma regulatory factor (Ser/Thr protein kinase)
VIPESRDPGTKPYQNGHDVFIRQKKGSPGVTAPTEWSMVASDAWEATHARSAIRAFLAPDADGTSDLDGVETIVGELVANVIQHAPGAVGIHVAWEGQNAILVVADRGPGIPALRPVPDGSATNGRGLFLIEALARRVEFDSIPGFGARILVELPVHRNMERAS